MLFSSANRTEGLFQALVMAHLVAIKMYGGQFLLIGKVAQGCAVEKCMSIIFVEPCHQKTKDPRTELQQSGAGLPYVGLVPTQATPPEISNTI